MTITINVKVLRALTLAVICLGGAAFILSSLSQDLVGFGGQPPAARAQLVAGEHGKAEDKMEPAEFAAEMLKDKEDQLRRLLEDSSEIDLRGPTFLQSEYRVEVEEEGEPLDLPRVVARVGALRLVTFSFNVGIGSHNACWCISRQVSS